jgi:hypothetical protein
MKLSLAWESIETTGNWGRPGQVYRRFFPAAGPAPKSSKSPERKGFLQNVAAGFSLRLPRLEGLCPWGFIEKPNRVLIR